MGAENACWSIQPLEHPISPAGEPGTWTNLPWLISMIKRIQRTMQALESIQEDEWDFGVDYPDWDPMLSGFVIVGRPLSLHPPHFEAHAAEIRLP